MYDTHTFSDYVKSNFPRHSMFFCNEFKRYDDEELLIQLDQYVSYMRSTDIDSEMYNEYFNDVQRIMECMNVRKAFRNQLIEDELV